MAELSRGVLFFFLFFFFGMVEMYDIPVIWVLKIVGREGRVSLVFFSSVLFFLSFFLCNYCIVGPGWLAGCAEDGMKEWVTVLLVGWLGCLDVDGM